MSIYIARRDDVNPEQGLREHGDVEFADPTNKKYPLENAGHVRSAWSYINHADNAAKYDKDEVETITGRIKRAAKTHRVEITVSPLHRSIGIDKYRTSLLWLDAWTEDRAAGDRAVRDLVALALVAAGREPEQNATLLPER